MIKLLILFFLVAAGTFLWWQYQLSSPSSSSSPPQYFVITTGESASSVISRLASAGLIRSSLAAKIYLKLTGTTSSFRPGSYQLSAGSSFSQLISRLASGPADVWVTFPEGWRREQMAARLSSTFPDFPVTDFQKYTASLEGQLFPDTYLIPSTADTRMIISLLTANFAKKSGLSMPTQTNILIIASLVEREAKTDPDRRLIAGILLKRLSEGMPLQVDATVQYAADSAHSTSKFWQPIVDTHFTSPYNTYLHPGLPPGPIANPGSASIQAVLHPQVSAYYYYLTDSSGITHYAATLAEHNLNIDKYLRF